MLAGGELFFGGRTPAKPRWSEVMIFLKVVLRQKGWLPGGGRQLREAGAHRKTDLRRRAQLRGAMLAEDVDFPAANSAKPPWSEVMIF